MHKQKIMKAEGFRWGVLFWLFFIIFTFHLSLLTFDAICLDVPPLKGYVNDYGGMISPSAKSKLEAELRAFEQSDSTQIVIVTIPSLGGETIEEYSIKVAEKWKIGQKGKDNGIIFLVAKQERKMRIEVGRGLEGRLTDLMAGQIIDMVIKPRFKRGDFDAGFIAGIHSMIDATRGEFEAKKEAVPVKRKGLSSVLTYILFAGIALYFLGSLSKTLGGIAGALGLPLIAYLTVGPPLITLILLAILGIVISLFMPLLFGGGWHGGGGTWYGGGYWGSSGNGGSYDSGGGFDGGGGDFGGGGASGDW